MLTFYANTFMLVITLFLTPPYGDRADEYTNRIKSPRGGVWFYDGEQKRTNAPKAGCETWTFKEAPFTGAKTVTIKPCQGDPVDKTWRIYWNGEAGYNMITIGGAEYVIAINRDSDSQILYMEFREWDPEQGARNLHKYFHSGS